MNMSLFTASRNATLQAIRTAPCPSCHRAWSVAPTRLFSQSPIQSSGHNRWSKIRHEKGAADQKKTAVRSIFSKNLALYSKLHGSDPTLNPALATTIAAARKAGLPKALIDSAIARGCGRSGSGERLEPALLEAMALGGSVAVVIDIETDNWQRALKDLKLVIKKHAATVTPTKFLFARRGRTVLRLRDGGAEGEEEDFDDVLMRALDAGAEDVEQDGEGNVVVWTQPSETHQTAQSLSAALEADILESDIIWTPNSEKVKVDDTESAREFGEFLAALREYDDVLAVYSNAERGDVTDEAWRAVEENS